MQILPFTAGRGEGRGERGVRGGKEGKGGRGRGVNYVQGRQGAAASEKLAVVGRAKG